jgi:hypothetical protein
MSSRGWPACRRVSISLKKPTRQSDASCGSESAGRAGMGGAAWRAKRTEEYQSQHVPMRSNIRALGFEGPGTGAAIPR